jgi:hypothetical protein
MLDDFRGELARGANFSVGGIVLELQREKFQREFGKLAIGNWRWEIGNPPAQARGEAG